MFVAGVALVSGCASPGYDKTPGQQTPRRPSRSILHRLHRPKLALNRASHLGYAWYHSRHDHRPAVIAGTYAPTVNRTVNHTTDRLSISGNTVIDYLSDRITRTRVKKTTQ
jgi:hypothetical protein